MHRTNFAGLTELDPGDPITVDGASFTQRNPSRTDFYLRIGAVTHRHDGHLPLADPTLAPSASTSTASGGQVAAGLNLFIAYSLTDSYGGETRRGIATQVTTPLGPSSPSGALAGVFDPTGGSLPVGQYAYAVTLNDAGGGESTLGPAVFVQRPAGYASGQINLSALAQEISPGVGPYVSWNLWRMQDGGAFQVIKTAGTTDTFTDTGLICTDAARTPPNDMSGVAVNNIVSVQLPTAVDPPVGSATLINLYISTDGSFGNPCLYNSYPVASGGQVITIYRLQLQAGAPPTVSLASQGAQKIDPDTEMLDWHWKRPVPTPSMLPLTGNASADTRVSVSPIGLWIWNGNAWIEPMGGSGLTVVDAIGDAFIGIDEIQLLGASGVTVSMASAVGGEVIVTIAGPSGGVGPAGPPGASGAPGPQGASGAQGIVGPIGPAGASGAAGPAGASGAPGATGPPGASGAPGATGPAGASGAVGATGPAGASGANGATGPQGPAGTAVTAVEDGVTRVTPTTDITFLGATVADMGGGSARVTVTGGGGGGGVIAVEGAGGSPRITPIKDIRVVASGGASAGVTDMGGGSAQISISTTPTPCFTVIDTAGGSAMAGGSQAIPIEFVGTGGASATVTKSGGSAIVTIAVSTGGGGGGVQVGSANSIAGAGAAALTPVESKVVIVPSADMQATVADQGGGLATVSLTHAPRATVTYVTGSALVGGGSANSSAAVDVPLGKSFMLMEVTSDDAVRLRLYTTPAKRDADVSRVTGVDPPINSGLILELVTNAANLDYHLSPMVTGADLRTPLAGVTAGSLTNLGATGTRTLTFKRLLLEG